MRIGFAGAHRTGKTTLAKAIAKIYGLPLVTSSGSEVVARHNFDMANDNRLASGMDMQTEQLAAMIANFRDGAIYVSDRTPIDAAAYLLADASAAAGNEVTRDETVRYVESAMRLTARYFDVVILVPPAISFDEQPGKPPLNRAYQEHVHMLVRGMLYDCESGIAQSNIGQIERTNIDRFDRVRAVCNFVAGRSTQLKGVAA